MQFVMAIGETVIESVDVNPEQVKDEAYRELLIAALVEKHWLTIAAYQQAPQFYLQVRSLSEDKSVS